MPYLLTVNAIAPKTPSGASLTTKFIILKTTMSLTRSDEVRHRFGPLAAQGDGATEHDRDDQHLQDVTGRKMPRPRSRE